MFDFQNLEVYKKAKKLHADEFHNFTTLYLIGMFSELRKFKVGMTMARQYMAQLDPDIKSAVLSNAGTIISFLIGTEDTMLMAK